MGLKLLHSADWHLDSPLASLPENVRTVVSENLRKLPERIADACLAQHCDLVLLSGDLFDGKPRRETVDAVKRALERCAVPVLIAPGNHDYVTLGGVWRGKWPDNVHIFTGKLSYIDFPDLSLRAYGAGYGSMDCPPLLEGFRAEGDARWCIGVLHGDPVQRSSPCCPVTAAQVRESGLDYLALGHIHKRGSFRGGNTLCAWPGCPMGRGWDETGEKGVYLAELDEQAEIIFLPLGLPEFQEYTVPVQGNGIAELESVLPGLASAFCRVTLTGEGKPDLDTIRARFDYLPLLEIRDETRDAVDPWRCAGEDSLRGMFFQMLAQQLEDADPETAEIIQLAAEISAGLLDGREVTLP